MTKTKYASAMLVALLAFTAPSYAATLTFDNETAATGNVAYGGTGGSVVGTTITFDDFDVTGAPVNNGDFTSGINTSEVNPYTWTGPGTATITGTIINPIGGAVIATGTLMTGTFNLLTATFNPATGQMTLVGLGTDTKNADLLSFFQITNPGAFTSTNISTGPCVPDAAGAFNCAVTEADVQNVNANQVVPEPATLVLFGLGLAGAGVTMRRRRS
jgi:hypothetical protein